MTEQGIYVYAVSRDFPQHALEQMCGIGGAPVRIIVHQGLTALVSNVDLAEFGEEALRRNLEDLGWLESAARAHNTVVAGAATLAVTVPMRLLTVYRSDERVQETLRKWNKEFTEALSRITGRTEWGAKAYADLKEFMTSGTTAEGVTTAGPGTSYLQRRRAERHTEEEARRAAMGYADEIDARLSDIAATRYLHPPQNPQLSGHEGWMILNASYLVDDSRAEEFHATVSLLVQLHPGISLELSGPWAPYSFATEDEPWTGC